MFTKKDKVLDELSRGRSERDKGRSERERGVRGRGNGGEREKGMGGGRVSNG